MDNSSVDTLNQHVTGYVANGELDDFINNASLVDYLDRLLTATFKVVLRSPLPKVLEIEDGLPIAPTESNSEFQPIPPALPRNLRELGLLKISNREDGADVPRQSNDVAAYVLRLAVQFEELFEKCFGQQDPRITIGRYACAIYPHHGHGELGP
jgi:hypothetical protein